MEREIGEQPSLLANAASKYYDTLQKSIGGRRFDQVLLAARGTSDHAAI